MQLENALIIEKIYRAWPTAQCSPFPIRARGHPAIPAHRCTKPAQAHLDTWPNGQCAPAPDRSRTRPHSRRWTLLPLPTTPMCATHRFTCLILCTIPSLKEKSFSSSSSRSHLRLCSAASALRSAPLHRAPPQGVRHFHLGAPQGGCRPASSSSFLSS
jgi:hypothetical protein